MPDAVREIGEAVHECAVACSGQAQALFLYTASNSDELSIEPGDVINVLQTELEDSGWWKGELNGKTGVFPDNFVVLISPDKMQVAV